MILPGIQYYKESH